VRASLKTKGCIAAHQFSKLSARASPKEKAGIVGRAARQFSELSARASLKCKGGIAARCNFKTKSPRTKMQNESQSKTIPRFDMKKDQEPIIIKTKLIVPYNNKSPRWGHKQMLRLQTSTKYPK